MPFSNLRRLGTDSLFHAQAHRTCPGTVLVNLKLVDRAKQVTFQKDEILIQKGKQTKMVYLLVKGTARIEADFKVRIAQIGPGQISGEMAFLENNVASATVTAEEEVQAYAIEWSALGDLFELFPHLASRFYRSLAVILARRLRDQIIG